MPSTRRDRQAQQTRLEILDAARGLFAERGYRATTVAQIAEAAGVAVQTIYDSIGSKAAIVAGLNDRIDEIAGVGELAAPIPTTDDPAALVAIPIQITRRILERTGDIARTAFRGASEPELAVLRGEGIRRHRAGLGMVAARLDALGGLAPGLAPDRAGDVLSVLCDPEMWLIWIDDYGWSIDDVAAWTLETATRSVLGRG